MPIAVNTAMPPSDMAMALDELAYEVHQIAVDHGFYDDDRGLATNGERLMLVVTEVAEAMEAWRADDYPHECEEIADVFIRLLDYAYARDMHIGAEVRAKIEKNRLRPYKHGKRF